MSGALNEIRIRFATIDDVGLLLRCIRDLAAYEGAPNAVVATEEDLRRYGFGPEWQFEALLAFLDGKPAGFALFHPRFSTWLGRPGVYLEDILVTHTARGKGVGRRLMTRLAAIAVERGWERIDFQVLDWNPARGFYRRLGLEHLGDWLRYGGDAAALRRLAAEDLPDRVDPNP
jgi:GNAT superfamily N-acetyltransferase